MKIYENLSKLNLDIIIQAGQSNAEGMGRGDVVEEYLPNEDVLYLSATKKVEHTPERVVITYAENDPFLVSVAQERKIGDIKIGDFSLAFAKKYLDGGKLTNGRKLLIVRAGIGGTGFKKGNWGVNDQLYQKMLEMTDFVLSLNINNRVVGFLWHQGEHDAFEGNTPENFYWQLTSFIQGVRKRYGTMPFIAGDFVNEWKSKNIETCEPIVNTIRKVINDNEKAAFVETFDLLSNNQKIGNGDDIHFCREALYTLGERYFEKYQKLINEEF